MIQSMSHDLVTVATYATPSEAAAARAALESYGLQTHLTNEAMLTWGWLYSNATGGAELQVPDGDVEQAREILAEALNHKQHAHDPVTTWRCSKCGVDVDTEMDLCWSCGTSKDAEPQSTSIDASRDVTDDDATASDVTAPDATTQNETAQPQKTSAVAPPSWFATVAVLAVIYVILARVYPYDPMPLWVGVLQLSIPPLVIGYTILVFLAPRKKTDEAKPTEQSDRIQDKPPALPPAFQREDRDVEAMDAEEDESPVAEMADTYSRRAWRGAIFGLCFMPPLLLNIYSVWQMCRFIMLDEKQMLPKYRKRLIGAFLINAIVFTVLSVLICVALQ
jgi:hypothetical protein